MMKRNQARLSLALGLAIAGVAWGTATSDEPCDLDKTKTLLREYWHQGATAKSPTYQSAALETLRMCGSQERLLVLFRQRYEPLLMYGSGCWASVCKAVGQEACVDDLLQSLSDPDPRWRAFACEAVGLLGLTDAIPQLIELLADSEISRGSLQRLPVSASAALALAWMGRAEGIPVMLDLAEEAPFWGLTFGDAFRVLSNDDCGMEPEAWRYWYETGSCPQKTGDPTIFGPDEAHESNPEVDQRN